MRVRIPCMPAGSIALNDLCIFFTCSCLVLAATYPTAVFADEQLSPEPEEITETPKTLKTLQTLKTLKTLKTLNVSDPILAPAPEQAIDSTDPQTDSLLYQQRQLYQHAVSAIRLGSRKKAEKLIAELQDYPLLPYIELEQHRARLRRVQPDTIQQFIDTHIDSPIGEQLRNQFLNQRMQRNQRQDFLSLYKENSATKEQRCYYADAIWQNGQEQKANEFAQSLWLNQTSMPKQCDPVFHRLRKAGGISQQLAWQRFELAVIASENQLARYLVRYLKPDTARKAQQLHELYRNPGRLNNQSHHDFRQPNQQKILSAALDKLARTHPESAFKALERYRQLDRLPQALIPELYAQVGFYLAHSGKMTETLDQLPLELRDYPKLIEARARFSIQQQDWSETLILLNLLPEEARRKPVWQYWRAVSLLSNNEAAEQASARTTLNALSERRNYYGYLAAARLNKPQKIQAVRKPVSADSVENLLATPATGRIRELIALGEIIQARREWFHLTRDFSTREHQITAIIARNWRWHDMAIRAYAQARDWNEIEGRFPLAYPEHFSSNALLSGIPLSLSLAVARKESAFWPQARSIVGAQGLMQLMPETGKLAAKNLGIKIDKGLDLTDPVINIRLGSWYLGRLFRRFDHNRIIALAAYNAGPTRVSQWLNRTLPVDVWIESIPYRETRDYVQTTLVYASIYADRLGQKQPMITPSERAHFSPSPSLTLSATAALEADSSQAQW